MIKSLKFGVLLSMFAAMASTVFAQQVSFDVGSLRNAAIPLHVIELVLAIFISYMTIKFFNLTRPLKLFLYVYTAAGFFVVSSLVFFFVYFSQALNLTIDFSLAFLASRVALIAMLATLTYIIFSVHIAMKTDFSKKK